MEDELEKIMDILKSAYKSNRQCICGECTRKERMIIARRIKEYYTKKHNMSLDRIIGMFCNPIECSLSYEDCENQGGKCCPIPKRIDQEKWQ